MASDPITFVQWRDAEVDPPEHENEVHTNVGVGWFDRESREWQWPATEDGRVVGMHPQPAVWCDPHPPVESTHGPLTMDDLREIADFPFLRFATPRVQSLLDAAARLRNALEEIS